MYLESWSISLEIASLRESNSAESAGYTLPNTTGTAALNLKFGKHLTNRTNVKNNGAYVLGVCPHLERGTTSWLAVATVSPIIMSAVALIFASK